MASTSINGGENIFYKIRPKTYTLTKEYFQILVQEQKQVLTEIQNKEEPIKKVERSCENLNDQNRSKPDKNMKTEIKSRKNRQKLKECSPMKLDSPQKEDNQEQEKENSPIEKKIVQTEIRSRKGRKKENVQQKKLPENLETKEIKEEIKEEEVINDGKQKTKIISRKNRAGRGNFNRNVVLHPNSKEIQDKIDRGYVSGSEEEEKEAEEEQNFEQTSSEEEEDEYEEEESEKDENDNSFMDESDEEYTRSNVKPKKSHKKEEIIEESDHEEVEEPETFCKTEGTESERRLLLLKSRSKFSRGPYTDNIPGRESEISEITKILSNSVDQSKGVSLLVTGKPGTGKTLILNRIVDDLFTKKKNILYINCMDLSSPQRVFETILKGFNANLKNQALNEDAIKKYLEDLFINDSNDMFIILLDEIEILLKSSKNLFELFFQWTNDKNSKLILIGISNLSDLGLKTGSKSLFKKISFNPYNSNQIAQILNERLKSTNIVNLVDPNAVNFIAKKIEAEGDLRMALDIMKKSIELFLEDSNQERITTAHVNQVFKNYLVSPMIKQIKNLPFSNQYILCTISRYFEENGKEINTPIEITKLISYQYEIIKKLNLPKEIVLSSSAICDGIERLKEYGIIKEERKKHYLTITNQDIHFALKENERLERILNV